METAVVEIPSEFVDRNAEMNPETDDLIRGRELKEGMVVLIEDSSVREDISHHTGETDHKCDAHKCRRIKETSRWCRVTSLDIRKRMEDRSPLVSFIAVYSDGTKRLRTYNQSFGWFVKLNSMGE